MNIEYFIRLFKENKFTDLIITLKDSNRSIQINVHQNILASNDYFMNLLTNLLKEKNANELTLEVSNVHICRDIIMSFYGIPINFTNHRYILEYIKCCDYWLVPYQNVLTDDLKVPEEDFDLLLEIGELMNYSDQVLKIISRNIPLEYDLSGIPSELKERMIRLNQINYIASGSSDNTIKIWDLDSGIVIKTLNGHSGSVTSVCYIPGKNQIAFDSVDNTIKIWDLNSGIEIKTLTGHTNSVWSICYIPEKNQIASGKDKVQPRWESDRLLTGSSDNTIKIWDLESGTEIKTLTGHTNSVYCVCYIPEKNQIASGSLDHTIKIWDLDSGTVVKTLTGHTNTVFSVCYIPEKNQIASGKDKVQPRWESDRLLTGSRDNSIKIWDLDSGTEIKTLTGNSGSIRSVCYIPEKNQIVSGSADNTIKIWDLDSGTEIKTLTGHTNLVWSICYIPEKNQIASGSRDNRIKIWDLDSGTVIKTLTGHTNTVFTVCCIQMESIIAKRLKN